MYRSEVITLISSRLGNRSGLDSQIKTELLYAQTQLERGADLPWFLLSRTTSLVTVAGVDYITVPSDFLREYDDCALILDGVVLKKDDYETLKGYSFQDTESKPTHYDLVNNRFYLFPTPGAVYTTELLYYAAGQTLDGTDDLENAWLAYAPGLLIGKVGMQLARFLRDPDGIKLFEQDFREAQRDLLIENTARKQAARMALMGG